MSDATAALLQRSKFLDLSGLPLSASRAQVIVHVAKQLVGRPDYKLGGRGGFTLDSLAFDEFGFVRYCASVARRWTPGLGPSAPETSTADVRVEAINNYVACVGALKAWGLERQNAPHPFPVRPGDIIVSVGRPPCLTIVTAAATPDRPATYAGVWPDETVTEGPYRGWANRSPGQFWRMPEAGL